MCDEKTLYLCQKGFTVLLVLMNNLQHFDTQFFIQCNINHLNVQRWINVGPVDCTYILGRIKGWCLTRMFLKGPDCTTPNSKHFSDQEE